MQGYSSAGRTSTTSAHDLVLVLFTTSEAIFEQEKNITYQFNQVKDVKLQENVNVWISSILSLTRFSDHIISLTTFLSLKVLLRESLLISQIKPSLNENIRFIALLLLLYNPHSFFTRSLPCWSITHVHSENVERQQRKDSVNILKGNGNIFFYCLK